MQVLPRVNRRVLILNHLIKKFEQWKPTASFAKGEPKQWKRIENFLTKIRSGKNRKRTSLQRNSSNGQNLEPKRWWRNREYLELWYKIRGLTRNSERNLSDGNRAMEMQVLHRVRIVREIVSGVEKERYSSTWNRAMEIKSQFCQCWPKQS